MSGRRGLLVVVAPWRGQHPDRVLEARLGDWWWSQVPNVARVFPGEIPALRRRRWRRLQVSCPS